jgi:hypothetical protein
VLDEIVSANLVSVCLGRVTAWKAATAKVGLLIDGVNDNIGVTMLLSNGCQDCSPAGMFPGLVGRMLVAATRTRLPYASGLIGVAGERQRGWLGKAESRMVALLS